MFIEFLRKWIGSTRFFLTLLLLGFSAYVIIKDLNGAMIDSSVYVFLGAVFAQVCVFIYSETVRRS